MILREDLGSHGENYTSPARKILPFFCKSRCHSLKLALANKTTPILHSSPTILVKSQKIYYTGRQLRDHGYEFVRMG